MKKIIRTGICFAIIMTCNFFLITDIASAANGPVGNHGLPDLQTKIGTLQIPFVKNQGQMHRDVAFYAQTGCGTFFVTKSGELVYGMNKAGEKEHSMVVIKEKLHGAKELIPRNELTSIAKVNYFKGANPKAWQRNIETSDILTLGEAYPGVEISLKAYNDRVEKIFRVNTGGDPAKIHMKVSGADALSVTAGGELALTTGLGPITFTKPVAFQEISGRKKYVDAAYKVAGSSYTFALGEYDRTMPLVIDPMLSTFIGGSGLEYGNALETLYIDQLYVYVVGYTASRTDFPNKTGVQTSYGGGDYDAFVARLDSNLRVMDTTYLGGSGDDEGWDISIASFYEGEPAEKIDYIYVVGFTDSTDFPTAPSAARGRGADKDGFVTRLSSDLSVMEQSRYLGGTNVDAAVSICMGNRIDLDPENPPDSIYVVGSTRSGNFPSTAGSAQPVHGSPGSYYDGFIARLDLDLGIIKASFLGGCSIDSANGVAVDGDVYVTGDSMYNPSCEGCIPGMRIGCFPWIDPNSFGGQEDAYVVRMKSDLTEVDNATYLGGYGMEFGSAIAINKSMHKVYVSGVTGAVYDTSHTPAYYNDFPARDGHPNGFQTNMGGGQDAYVARFS